MDEFTLEHSPSEIGLSILRLRGNAGRGELIGLCGDSVLARFSVSDRARMVVGVQTGHEWLGDLAVLPGGEEMVVATPGGMEVRRCDDLRVVKLLAMEGGAAVAVAGSGDGRFLAAATSGEEVVVFDRATYSVLARVRGGERTMAIGFSADSKWLASACSFQGGGYVRVDGVGDGGVLTPGFRLDRSDFKTEAGKFADTISSVAWSSDGRRIAILETSAIYQERRPAGWRGDVVLYDAVEGREIGLVSIDGAVTGDGRSLAEAGFEMGWMGEVVFVGDAWVACGVTGGGVVLLSAHDLAYRGRRAVRERAGVFSVAVDSRGDLWAGLENGEVVRVEV